MKAEDQITSKKIVSVTFCCTMLVIALAILLFTCCTDNDITESDNTINWEVRLNNAYFKLNKSNTTFPILAFSTRKDSDFYLLNIELRDGNYIEGTMTLDGTKGVINLSDGYRISVKFSEKNDLVRLTTSSKEYADFNYDKNWGNWLWEQNLA